MQKRLNSIFNDFAGVDSPSASFVPAVDVYEDAEKLVLKLEIPGVKAEDLDIKLENQSLVIKGERKFESTEKAENFHRIERRFGSFVRSFTLPQTVDTRKRDRNLGCWCPDDLAGQEGGGSAEADQGAGW